MKLGHCVKQKEKQNTTDLHVQPIFKQIPENTRNTKANKFSKIKKMYTKTLTNEYVFFLFFMSYSFI